jgi:predicted DNA-binding transcriptional regulator YafY
VDTYDRALELLFRLVRGEEISVRKMADEHGVSTKSISRDLARIKDFLAENRELTGNAEVAYSNARKAHRLASDEFLTSKELFAIAKTLLGARAFSAKTAAGMVEKFKRFTTSDDREKLEEIVRKELRHYSEIRHDCKSVTENLWRLVNAIHEKKEITLHYYKMDRLMTEKRIQPASLIFMEYYFYLIAYYPGRYGEPRYFRVDRIKEIVEHRKPPDSKGVPDFDEGLLRKRCQFMFYGPLREIRFEYSGPSVQSILDRLPTAKIVARDKGAYTIDTEVHGDGIKMFLLSQGAWVKVLAPQAFAEELKADIENMLRLY